MFRQCNYCHSYIFVSIQSNWDVYLIFGSKKWFNLPRFPNHNKFNVIIGGFSQDFIENCLLLFENNKNILKSFLVSKTHFCMIKSWSSLLKLLTIFMWKTSVQNFISILLASNSKYKANKWKISTVKTFDKNTEH